MPEDLLVNHLSDPAHRSGAGDRNPEGSNEVAIHTSVMSADAWYRGAARMLAVGDGKIAVPTELVGAGIERTLCRKSERRLVVRNTLSTRFVAALCVVVGTIAGYLFGVGEAGRIGIHPILAFVWAGVPFIAAGLLLEFLPARFAFDLDAGQMQIWRFWTKKERSLKEIVAVQLIRAPKKIWTRQGEGYPAELNLVLDDDRQRRVGLSGCNWSPELRSAGVKLARFLGVPLLEELPETTREKRWW